MVELDVPAMVHVSASCNPNFHATGAHYINADTTAFMQFLTADLFKDFPTLRLIIPHGGGAVPYHWGRYRGLAQDMKRPPLADLIRNNVFFDTCVYHQAGIELLLKIVPARQHPVRLGDGRRGARHRSGDRATTSTTPSATSTPPRSRDADKQKIFEGNARKVYPRINKSADGCEAVDREAVLAQRLMKPTIVRNIHRADADVIARSASLASPPCTKRRGASGCCVRTCGRSIRRRRWPGSAITISCQAGDNLMIHAAIELCRPGDVLVVTTTSESTDGMFGELLAVSARAHGVVGLVIDAGVRDVADLTTMDFPVWSKAIHAQGTVKATAGSVNVPVVCAGATIQPGRRRSSPTWTASSWCRETRRPRWRGWAPSASPRKRSRASGCARASSD